MTSIASRHRTVGRSMAYRWFYHAFQYPAEGSGLPFIERETPSALGTLDEPALKEKVARFTDSLGGVDMETLQVEYVRLFDYRPACPPCESAYRKNMNGGQLIGELAGIYREGGLKCSPTFSADHISVQFEFMHYLTRMEQSAANGDALRYRDLERRFLEEHLMKWVPAFCDDLKARGVPPYSLLGEILRGFLLMEQGGLCGPDKSTEKPGSTMNPSG